MCFMYYDNIIIIQRNNKDQDLYCVFVYILYITYYQSKQRVQSPALYDHK